MRMASALVVLCSSACHLGEVGPTWSPWAPQNNPPSFGPIDGGPSENRPPQGPPPVFGSTVSQTSAPPALSGGTLLVLRDGVTAVAADPDRDRIYVVDLNAKTRTASIALQTGDEPGRIAEDGAGVAHVLLRFGGAEVSIDPKSGQILQRRAVCAAPRGIAYDGARDQLQIACAGGELVTLPASTGAPTRTVMLERDLRDVLVFGDQLFVSKLRTAEVLRVDADGKIGARLKPDDLFSLSDTFTPAIAWRTILSPTGEILMAHQRGTTSVVGTGTGGYGHADDPCGSIVQGTVSVLTMSGSPPPAPTIHDLVLPVDLAVSHDGKQVAVIAAGNAHTPDLPTLFVLSRTQLTVEQDFDGGASFSNCTPDDPSTPQPGGEPVALAYDGQGRVVVQSREPAQLQIIVPTVQGAVPTIIELSNDSRADTGHAIFHSNSSAGLACASCHAEGGEDGRTWSFDTTGGRRTQSLRGGILGTEPFHWDGDQTNLDALMHEVFMGRMSGPMLASDQIAALGHFVDAIRLLPKTAPADAAQVERGRTLFEAPEVGCASCHFGTKLTNNATVDVGAGAAFQVPGLRGLAFRAPFLHDGCAATLSDRFGICATETHGHTSQLSQSQIADLIAYLETL